MSIRPFCIGFALILAIALAAPLTARGDDDCGDLGSRKTLSAADLAQVIKVFQGIKIKRGEFETTPEFEARIAPKIREASTFIEKRIGNSEIVVSVPLWVLSATYDADAAILKIDNEYGLVESTLIGSIGSDESKHFIPVSTSNVTSGSYVGQNAFGVKKVITTRKRDAVGIAVSAVSSSTYFWPETRTPIEVAMSPADAKRSKGKIVVVIAGNLISPYLVKSVIPGMPTISNPNDTTYTDIGLMIEPRCAAIVNKVNGEILSPLKF